MSRLALLALAATALIAVGCGDDDGDGGGASSDDAAMVAKTADAAMKAKRKGAVVKVVDSQYGDVVADRRGEALYLFDKEDTRKSECYGACAEAWPPMLTKAKPRAGEGARKGLLATTRRRDGKLQVTYAGHPLYYYKDDSPGNILCHDVDEFGGLWLVVEPSGEPVG